MKTKPIVKKKPAAPEPERTKHIAAGEFKAKCLGILDEVSETCQEVIVTKRGRPIAKVVPFRAPAKGSFFGRLKGVIEIVGDPDDLINPVFPLEDYDMLK
jgi:prevent-host-death family protein